jgi:hypothetical protein
MVWVLTWVSVDNPHTQHTHFTHTSHTETLTPLLIDITHTHTNKHIDTSLSSSQIDNTHALHTPLLLHGGCCVFCHCLVHHCFQKIEHAGLGGRGHTPFLLHCLGRIHKQLGQTLREEGEEKKTRKRYSKAYIEEIT